MRIDQLLWHLRYYKSRSLATTACKKGHVKVNDHQVKPSKEILNLDIVKVRKNQMNYKFKILDIPYKRIGAKLLNIYIEDQTDKNEINSKKLIKSNLNKVRFDGKGRPTKKQRRELDDMNI